ncbi:MAG: restriction endonuclease subunit S [Deltaproteobacteria bacterium]|nr:restriction endonuclease subunit S [Deltaproteobacteria bacterium]
MSADWQEVRLEDITSILGDGIHGTPKYEEKGEYSFINGNNLSNGKIIIDEKTKRASKEEYLKYKKNLNDRTILVSINGTIGNIGLYNGEKVFLGKSACYFNVLEDVDKQFIRYVVTSKYFQNYINSLATGSTIKNVSLKLMRDFTFRLPPLEIQKQISKVLEDLDDKIQLNRQINQTLEQTAQAIFKSWFVDFEPVKAKIEAKENGQDPERSAMRAISGKSDEELDQLPREQFDQIKATAVLFPDEMVETELGEIPSGWVWSTIGNEVDVVGGGTPSTKNGVFWDSGTYHWTTPKDLSGLADKILLSTERKLTEAGIGQISSGLLPVDTVLLSSRAPVGYLVLSKIPTAINQGFIAMKCNRRLKPEFVLQWTASVMDEIKQRSSGSTFAEISKTNFRLINVLVPSKELVDDYVRIAKIIYEKITESALESSSLSEMRDSLLPKLLSGEITLSNTHRMAEADA